ncbi:histidinol-phosphate transaminase [Candidatus Pelagibacter bacterium nBUS_33]|uniref:histidinol-phosphate transaminase n=1 Tax=Candidatus Pelagibacter bacterium nBUS_33 TaxID=3374193 RepID=UPI003EB98268
MTTPKFKKFNIEPYKPGKSKVKKLKKIIKLSANESALGMSSKAAKIITNKKLNLERYPDGKSELLRKEISKKYKCDFEKIICGAGSDEIIQMICQLFLKPKDQVVVPQYSFLMYRIYANIVGAKVVFAKEINFKISITEIIKKVTKSTKIVFIANPNNPTGTYLTKTEIIELRKKLNKKILLVVDDAYAEYMKNKDYKSGLELFKNMDNVFILRTFSKIFGLASLRVGWGFGSKKIINALNIIKPPFNVSHIAQLAATEALKDRKFIDKSIKHNFLFAKKIKTYLEQYQIFSNSISANFLLLDFKNCKYSAKYLYEKLKQRGIIVRSTEDGYHIRNKLRLTIGSKRENLAFINAVKNILN